MDETDGNAGCCTLPAQGGVSGDGAGAGVRIYGKQGCPHTDRARRALPEAEFLDVLAQTDGPERLAEMLRLSGGVRRVPVIVRVDERGESVEIGFKRGA